MKALGLNISGYISSAALVEDGRILSAACEERLTRIKRDRSFPVKATQWALKQQGWTLEQVDQIAVAWNPARNLERNFGLLSEANRLRGLYLAYVPNALATGFDLPATEVTQQHIFGRTIQYVDHHLAHAASACFTSPWQDGAFVTVDAFGETDSLTIGRFQQNTIEVLERVGFPHSMGSFYSYLTEFLGFKPDSDEYKVMALGAFATPAEGEAMARKLASTYQVGTQAGGFKFEMELSLFDHYLFHKPRDFGPLAERLGIMPRKPQEKLESGHFAVAWALQYCFEQQLFAVLRHARALTGVPRVALAGGCFMNSVANGKLERGGAAFEHVHIPPYPDDSGTAMGAALYATLHNTQTPRFHGRHNFFGPSIATAAADEAIRRRKLPAIRLDEPALEVARRVADGEIVGYAAGAMEFGQRALGHRSIFADPRDPDIKDKVNQHVKRREWFRPYAASVLAERIAEVFDFPGDAEALFMEKVALVRPEWATRIPGILHHDGSVRLHSVDSQTNPRLHAILKRFESLTGIPLILNTSFNVDGMPIVCTADDALGCFYACGLDSLVLEDQLLTKALVPAGARHS